MWLAGLLTGAMVMVVAAAAALPHASTPEKMDVLVYGSTPSGVAAAIAASRAGQRVALVDPGSRVGGMASLLSPLVTMPLSYHHAPQLLSRTHEHVV